MDASPTVTRPIAATAAVGEPSHHYPCFEALDDLNGRRYVELEFFIGAKANQYNTPDGVTGSVIDVDHKSKTHVVVRWPTSAAKFNGTDLTSSLL